MRSGECVDFLRWALPQLRLRWSGFRKVHGQVCKRLRRRLMHLGLASLDEYRSRLEHDPAEWARLDDLCHVTISRFYRDRHVFHHLGTRILPGLGRIATAEHRRVACWCAGSASGEEVYSLKVLWDLDVQPSLPDVRLQVIGTDADAAVLQRAERGCYGWGSLKDVPASWLDSAFERRGTQYCVCEPYRDGVALAHQDIRREVPEGSFDLVFCRNLVFTYFDPELQRETLARISSVLRDGGYLVIGAGEQVPGDGFCYEPEPGCPEILRNMGTVDH